MAGSVLMVLASYAVIFFFGLFVGQRMFKPKPSGELMVVNVDNDINLMIALDEDVKETIKDKRYITFNIKKIAK